MGSRDRKMLALRARHRLLSVNDFYYDQLMITEDYGALSVNAWCFHARLNVRSFFASSRLLAFSKSDRMLS